MDMLKYRAFFNSVFSDLYLNELQMFWGINTI